MSRYKLVLCYDGSRYSGWQTQPHTATIQETLQKALSVYLRQTLAVTGAGRTDAGVHARGQVAHFDSDQNFEPAAFLKAMNGILPYDIRVLSVESVPDHFHARYGAKQKVYHYHLNRSPFQDPFRRLYSHHVRHALDLDLLRAGARCFLGTHNFSSFANEAYAGSAAKNPIRHIQRLDVVVEEDARFVRLEFQAESFLYKMVRNITGTLLEICAGKRPVEDIPRILQAHDRRQAGKAAPARGLFLVSVDYPSASVHTPS